MQSVSIGRIVHLQTAEGSLPAMVVRVFSPTLVNLRVFLDRGGDGTRYETSVQEGPEIGQWHWPERTA